MAAEQPTTMTLELSSPESRPYTQEVREVIVPGQAGVFSVRPGHTPTLSTLDSGVLQVVAENGAETFLAIHGGFAEVLEVTVRILTPLYERGEDIDTERANLSRERAEQRLNLRNPEDDLGRAEAALRRAMARLAAHQGEAI